MVSSRRPSNEAPRVYIEDRRIFTRLPNHRLREPIRLFALSRAPDPIAELKPRWYVRDNPVLSEVFDIVACPLTDVCRMPVELPDSTPPPNESSHPRRGRNVKPPT